MCVECGCEEAEEQQCAVPQNVVMMAASDAGDPAATDEPSRQDGVAREPRTQSEEISVQR